MRVIEGYVSEDKNKSGARIGWKGRREIFGLASPCIILAATRLKDGLYEPLGIVLDKGREL